MEIFKKCWFCYCRQTDSSLHSFIDRIVIGFDMFRCFSKPAVKEAVASPPRLVLVAKTIATAPAATAAQVSMCLRPLSHSPYEQQASPFVQAAQQVSHQQASSTVHDRLEFTDRVTVESAPDAQQPVIGEKQQGEVAAAAAVEASDDRKDNVPAAAAAAKVQQGVGNSIVD